MTDPAPSRTEGPVRHWLFDPDHPRFTDVPLLTRDSAGEIVAVRGPLPRLTTEMAEAIEAGTTYGVLTNPEIDLIELAAVGQEVIDPRECWRHTYGDEAYAADTLAGYRDGVARLLRTLNRAAAAGWEVIATYDDGLALGPRP
jgi:hypothetical protein